MKNKFESNRLLDEVFQDVASDAFRAELLGQTLAEARRRNRARNWNQSFLALAAVALAVLVVWRREAPRIVPQPILLSDVAAVRSVPLGRAELVETIPGSTQVISSMPSTVAFVETQPFVQELNDTELLALMDGTPVVLIRKGPHDAELLVVDAATSNPRLVDDTYQRDMPNQ